MLGGIETPEIFAGYADFVARRQQFQQGCLAAYQGAVHTACSIMSTDGQFLWRTAMSAASGWAAIALGGPSLCDLRD